MTPILSKQLINNFLGGKAYTEINGVMFWVRIETVGKYTGAGKKRKKVKDSGREFYEIRKRTPGGMWEMVHKERK